MQINEPAVQLALNFGENHVTHNFIDREFNAEFASQLAERESFNKHLYRPNTYLHKWWARRCGTTFRAILKHLVSDTSLHDYYAPGGLEGRIILDPMIGGGTTLHEAIRLGANVVGADIDPIPVLQARATLTETPFHEIEAAFSAFTSSLQSALGHYYRAVCPVCSNSYQQRFVLYGLRRSCECEEAVFVDSYDLRHNHDGTVIHISPDTYDILIDDDIISECDSNVGLPLYEKTRRVCSRGHKYADDVSVPYYRRYIPLAIVGECSEHGLFFAAPHQSDLDSIHHANERRRDLPFVESQFVIVPGPKSGDLVRRGVNNYLDLFSSRLLLYLHYAINELGKFEHSTRLKLAMLISTSIEFNSMLCGYKGAARSRPGAIRHTFAQHAYSFPYTALENNPLHTSRSSGTLENLFQSRLARGHKWAIRPIERKIRNDKTVKVPIRGEVDLGMECHDFSELQRGTRRFLLIQGSSTHLNLPDESIDHVVTDPPYFDSVQYGDLAAYFRVWLRKLLPEEVEWDYSLDAAAIDQQANGNGQFESILGAIFAECNRVLKSDGGRLIFTFHHWNPKGWAGLTIALKNSGFSLVNRYVIHAENPSSVHIANQNALVHDVILVLGKIGTFPPHTWHAPPAISTHDSQEFCDQCGVLLGHLLDSKLADDEIRQVWRTKLSTQTQRE
jgi:putative DNA methylase